MKKINYREIFAYLIVGGLTTVVSLSVYYICTRTFCNPENPVLLQVANIISWTISVIFAYFTNRKYVFNSKEKNILKEGSKFCLSRVSTLLLDMAIMFVMVSLLGINDKISKIVSQIAIIIGNYIISKFFVFKKKNDKNTA